MTSKKDIRWIQRFSNYRKALNQLEKFILKGDLSELEEQGLIKAFEYTYELAWNTLKDYLEYQGITNIIGSRDVIREAFKSELIVNGDSWMQMLQSRNLTSHSYNEDTADEIVSAILNNYFDEFKTLESKLESLRSGTQNDLFKA
ncbi:nucleotidyltransferase substrate binding protein [Mucilaginibacter phyllosphaerae]|uniref:Nucleotidyltransferase n=1 Tax=Mucilaginibacter phyllosphaerae TaxID=1812349 RepID=A0A4Y8AI27_9SPHI|nr:nucleotidyltransferase substrate binding protein [Mucilaginibacter phyllosphaerae]MBB3968440.1 nucleotidyltransferase substrate binding protein (TIGR01987 family) [Mucilaginibacter phyllosphaerae]TEW67912.1 nucleotidyltransferase [Mucilaginibacter phyllosphaerae]GGH15996.1 nucleotidyltransferase [Mucilaginibacter phyllosphaerae]